MDFCIEFVGLKRSKHSQQMDVYMDSWGDLPYMPLKEGDTFKMFEFHEATQYEVERIEINFQAHEEKSVTFVVHVKEVPYEPQR